MNIKLPYRDPTSPVSEIGECAVALPEEERQTVRELAVLLATEHNCKTVGDALEYVKAADPAARRELLGHARTRAGLPTPDQVEQAEHEAAISAAAKADREAAVRRIVPAGVPS